MTIQGSEILKIMTTLDFEQARHLVARTGFGPEPDTIEAFVGLSRQQAIDILLTAPRNYLAPQPVLHSFHQLREIRKADKKNDTRMANKLFRQEAQSAKNWAVEQALTNPNALQEKMTWFWHNHFTSSVRNSRRSINLLMAQSLLIRQHAMGSFATLLSAIAHDPFMLIYLDGINNRKKRPNENFARELLELFTLGEGHYTEADIKNVARAFTGLKLDNATQRIIPQKKQFDDGKKIIFSKKGTFDNDDVITLLLKQSRTAEFIAEKMWYEFISIESPDKAITQRWATVFRDSHYSITALLEAILMDDVFWQKKYRGQLIKSPLDLVIGTLRSLDLEDKELPFPALSKQLQRMGQDLYTPPNVKGWPGGTAWIDDVRLPLRQQFLRRLVRGNKNQANAKKPSAMMSVTAKANNTMTMKSMNMKQQNNNNALHVDDLPSIPTEQWEAWLLPVKASTPIQQASSRRQLEAILLDPAYQLK